MAIDDPMMHEAQMNKTGGAAFTVQPELSNATFAVFGKPDALPAQVEIGRILAVDPTPAVDIRSAEERFRDLINDPEVGENKVNYNEIRGDLKTAVSPNTTEDNRKIAVEKLSEAGVELPPLKVDGREVKANQSQEDKDRNKIYEAVNCVDENGTTKWKDVKSAKEYLEGFGITFEEGEVLVDPVEPVVPNSENGNMDLESLILAHEEHFVDRFFRTREIGNSSVDNISDRIDARNVLEVSGYSPERIAAWEARIAAGDENSAIDEMFAEAQNIYLNHLINPEILVSFSEKMKRIDLQRTASGQEPVNEIRNLSREIVNSSIKVGEDRGWSGNETKKMADFLGRKFGAKEKEVGVEVKVLIFYQTLKEDYARTVNLESDVNFLTRTQKIIEEIKEMEMRSGGISTKAEQLRNELAAIAFIHDLRISSDLKSAIDQDFVDRAGRMDGHLKTILSLSNPENGDKAVIDYLVAFDQVACDFSTTHPNDFFKLNDPTVLPEIRARIDRGPFSDLFLGIAKDMYRVTGGDARYAVARDHTLKEGKVDYASSADVKNGGAFRSVIHFRKSVCGDTHKNILIKHLDLGVTSYWEKILGKPTFDTTTNRNSDFDPKYSRNFAVLNKAVLEGIVFDASGVGEGSFSEWASSMKGAAEARVKELTFMGNASVKSWIANISTGVYFYDAYGRKVPDGEIRVSYEKRVPYVQARLADLTDYLLSYPANKKLFVSKDLDEVLTTGLVDEELLTTFKKSRGLPTGILDQPAVIGKELAVNLSGQRGKQTQLDTGVKIVNVPLKMAGAFLKSLGIFK